MTDIAFNILSTKTEPVSFKQLWAEVNEVLRLEPSVAAKKISLFYTNLSLDGRFVALKENNWELKKRMKFEDAFIDTSSIEIDDSDVDDDFIEEEDKEIDAPHDEY